MRDEARHDDGFSLVKEKCWRDRSWKSGLGKWRGSPAAQPWREMGHSGASWGPESMPQAGLYG